MVDELVEAAIDLRLPYLRLIYQHSLEEKANEQHKKVTHEQLKNLEAILKRSKTQYIASAGLSIADATWFDVIDNHLRLYSDLLGSFPLIKAWYEHFSALPNVKAYLGSDRRHKQVNANGLG